MPHRLAVALNGAERFAMSCLPLSLRAACLAAALLAPAALRAESPVFSPSTYDRTLAALDRHQAIAALGGWLAFASVRAHREERFPPSGRFGFGATRTWAGAPARRVAVALGLLAVALALCSIAAGGLLWVMGERLLACRAL